MKNKLLVKIALFCSAFLIAASAVVGITFSMYIKTSEKAKETGTVAKFGITMAWEDDSAFETSYNTDTTVTGVTTAVTGTSDRIAPGTTGSITMKITGSSEVAFNLTLDIVEEYSEGWKVSSEANAEAYKPINLTVTSTLEGANVSLTQNKGGASTLSIKDFNAGVTVDGTVTITWDWDFDANNTADNYVESLDSATYSLTAKVTATQID